MAFSRFLWPNIEKLRKNRDIPGLREALSHDELSVRAGAAVALADLGDEGADTLTHWLAGQDPARVGGILTALLGKGPFPGSQVTDRPGTRGSGRAGWYGARGSKQGLPSRDPSRSRNTPSVPETRVRGSPAADDV